MVDLFHIRNVAVAAASRSGELLRNSWSKPHCIEKKRATDLVTEADKASEKLIVELIKRIFPDHCVLAEESGQESGNEACQWIVDPLDGTTNFAHGLLEFSVSIAFALEGTVRVGVVLCPLTGELFSGISNDGAKLNGRSITISSTRTLEDSLLVTGFPYEIEPVAEPVMARFKRCLSSARGVRRLGSAAMDLCYVACGRFEGFWEQNLAPWDTAAGVLIAREAGATITDFSGGLFSIEKKEILATNGIIHKRLQGVLTL